MTEEPTGLGRLAYERYCHCHGWAGTWLQLTDFDRQVWESVAQAVWLGLRAGEEARLVRHREALASVSHDIWGHWMRWMFTTGVVQDDGTWVMPAALRVRWQRQMETPYAQLSEPEKESDREQADRILACLTEHGSTA